MGLRRLQLTIFKRSKKATIFRNLAAALSSPATGWGAGMLALSREASGPTVAQANTRARQNDRFTLSKQQFYQRNRQNRPEWWVRHW